MYIILETHGGATYAAICTDEDGNNLVFDTTDEAKEEAKDCQDPVIVEI